MIPIIIIIIMNIARKTKNVIKMTRIPIIIGALGTIPKKLESK